MTLYDHFHGPPPPVWLIRTAIVVPGFSALWLFQVAMPYMPTVWINALCPLAVIPLMLRWPEDLSVGAGEDRITERRFGLIVLWTLPSASLAWRAFDDLNWVFSIWSPLAGVGVGVLYTAVVSRLDRRMGAWSLGAMAVFASLWGWATLMFINVEFDPTPGAVRPAVIVENRIDSGDVTHLKISTTDGALDQASLKVYRLRVAGRVACVEDNPGLLGWRVLSLASCTGPLRDLEAPA